MRKALLFLLIIQANLPWAIAAESTAEPQDQNLTTALKNQENDDLLFDKMDRQTPANVNDDHMVIRKLKGSEKENLAVSGGNIYFEIDKSEIVPTEHIKLEEMAKALTKIATRIDKIVIEGFASRDGDPTRNFDLGIERAKSVKSALIKQKIADNIIETYSYGEDSMYRFANINKNRRAQIKIFLKKKE